jgi:O-antigen/teichoic acid export membrane protein
MSLLKNSSIVIVGVIVSNMLAYAFHFIAGRMLGPEEYGEFGALMALFLLVALPATALGFAITKFTSRFLADNKLGHIAWLRKKIQNDVLLFAATMLLFIILFSNKIALFLKIESNTAIIIVGITLVAALILPVNRGVLQGMKKYAVFSWNNIIESFFRLLLLIGLLYMGYGVNGAILAYGLAYFIAFLLIFPFIKETRLAVSITDKIDIKPIYKFIFLVLLVNLMIQSIINVPSLFIKHYYSSEFTGYWTAALNIARISLFITGAIALVMFPEIAGEKEKILQKKIFNKAAVLVFLASAGMAALFFIVPDLLIKGLYGKAFLGAVPILEWMGLAMIFIGLLQLWSNYFLAKLD